MTFGEKIKNVRINQGISQLQLGERMNISQQAVAKYERLTDPPKFETVLKIAQALNVSWSDLMPEYSYEKTLNDSVNKEIREKIIKGIIHIVSENEQKLVNDFSKLNSEGQEKALEQVELLTKIPEYKADK